MEIEFRSDNEEDDEEEFDSDDDEMPDLISSPSNATSAKKSSSAKPAKAPAASSAFPVRKVRFGNIVAEDLVDENGIVRDGYDYTQHMREMGKGKFYSADGQFSSQSELARRVELPEDVLPSAEEQDRLLDAITLTTDLMDEDLREALINDEAFEEIDDDFMVQAAVVDPEEAASDGFDYDAHIAKLMEAASGVPKFRGNFGDDEDEDGGSEFDSDEDDSEEDYEIDEASKAEEQRVLDALFEKTLAEEYDDEQLGELEEDDPETRGKLMLEGELLDSIVEDFVTVRLEMLNDEGKIGNPLRTGNRLKEIIEECAKEREEAEALAEAEGGDTMPEDEDDVDLVQALKDLYVRNSYLTTREEEQWDCETIVSTYSNLDNHPTILREENVNKRKKKRSALANMDHDALVAAANGNAPNNKTIVLSKKTGMPLGVFETAKKEEEREINAKAAAEAEAIALLSKREKSETKEEKKARKEAVKQLKNQRRQEKKQWKTAFKDEEQRQLGLTPGGKVSIFKY